MQVFETQALEETSTQRTFAPAEVCIANWYLVASGIFVQLKVGFEFRRYDQYGFWRTIFEWYWIVLQGGVSNLITYTKREYKNPCSDPKIKNNH